jgi:CRISPR-associated endonuclease/helicase Cas3
LSPAQRTALISAAQLHDIGKSLKQWQDALPTPRPDGTTLWAKAPSLAKRPGMRHEAASALAAWHQYYCLKNQEFPALAIYLIAAHHGLVRTVLSSRPSPAQQPNIAGIPITEPPPRLPFNNWQLDFTSIADGMDGTFSEDNTSFTPDTPGWSALVADLLGGWDADVQQATTGAIRTNNSNESHSLNPFILSYYIVNFDLSHIFKF